jgi:hypothetical protein
MEQIYFEKSKIRTFGIYWYKNKKDSSKIEPQYKALYHCLSNVKEDKQVIYKSNGFNMFWGIANYEQVKKMIEKDNGIYEVLPEMGKRKVYFDIDTKKEEAHGSFIEHLEKCKEIILNHFPDARLQISGSESKKFSYHIILSNYYADNLSRIKLNLKAFCLCYQDYGFDTCVYTKNRNMKCINQTKGLRKITVNGKQRNIKDNRVQAYIEGSTDLSKHLIMWNFDKDAKNIKDIDFSNFLQACQRTETGNVLSVKQKRQRLENLEKGIDIINLKPTDKALSLDFDYANAGPLEKIKVLPNYPKEDKQALHHNICMKVLWWCKKKNLTFEDFWNWYKIKDNSTDTKIRYLNYWNGNTYYVGDKFIDEMLEIFYPKLKKGYNFHQYEHLIDVNSKTTKELGPDEYLTKEEFTDENKTVILGCGCGKGKTESVIQYIKTLPQEKSVLILVPRITLSYDIQNRLMENELKFANYKEDDIRDHTPSRLIISTTSLYKIGEYKYDIVVCDEFETLLNTFTAMKIHKNGSVLPSNWETFKGVLKSCDKLILMDAITTRKTIEFVEGLGYSYSFINNKREITRTIREIKCLDVTENGKDKIVKEIDKEKNFFGCLLESLKKGEKCFVFMPYKEGRKEKSNNSKECIRGVLPLLNYICDKLNFVKGIDIEGYYAEAYDEKLRLRKVNETWQGMKCVITNTTNSVGINYDLQDFDNVFIYYAPWCNPRDVIQVLNRPRKIKNTEMKIYIERENPRMIERRVYGKLGVDAVHRLMQCEQFRNLIKNITIEENACCLKAFKTLCKMNGIHFEKREEWTENQDLIKFENNDDYRITYDKIKDISREKRTQLLERYEGGKISLYEKYQLEKYNFKNENSVKTPDEDILSYMWRNRDYINAFKDIMYEEEHGIDLLLKENGIDILNECNFAEFPKGKIPDGFELKRYKFIENFKFKYIEKSRGYSTFRKIINDFFGNPIQIDRKGDTTDVEFGETLYFFQEHNRKYNNIYKKPDWQFSCMIEE